MLLRILIVFFGLIVASPVYAMNQIIIKFKPTAMQMQQITHHQITQKELNRQLMTPLTIKQLQLIKNIASVDFFERNAIATGAHVIDTQQNLSVDELNLIVDKLRAMANIDYVEVSKFFTKNSLTT